MKCDSARELLTGLVDQELGLQDAIAVETHLRDCPACGAIYQEQKMQRTLLQQQLAYFQAPAELAQRIQAALPSAQITPIRTTARPRRWLNFSAIAASFIAVVISTGLYFMQPSATEQLADEVISSHVRGLITQRLTDVASSDQHTVKPWFNGKLDFSPPVRDLTTEGFPLIGGRLDYLDHRAVATLVYRHRQHLISLFIYPTRRGLAPPTAAITQHGYHLLTWTQDGMDYWLVSDVDPVQLQNFKTMLTANALP
jgi:anti-sigma factor RsiW